MQLLHPPPRSAHDIITVWQEYFKVFLGLCAVILSKVLNLIIANTISNFQLSFIQES